MTASRSVNSSVDVDVDPATAFQVFTEELDCWWVQGPINFHDSSRAHFNRMEPGVGGRIVEVYDDTSVDGLELARITTWEPGVRLAWKSSIDDVSIEVHFDESADGTRVRVEATIPDDGTEAGGTAWVRMTPVWLDRWMRRRDRVEREPLRLGRLAVAIHYDRPAAAGQWLRDVFGLEPAADIPKQEPEPEQTWIEFHVGDCSLMLFGREGEAAKASATHTPWIFVDDLDAHFAHAKANGAQIVRDIWQHGPRAYEVADLEGHRWTFAQASPRMR